MATLTLYVRQEARPLFERAKRLAGEESLSNFIEKALADYVERLTENKEGDFREYRLRAGPGNRRIVFRGRNLWPPDSSELTDSSSPLVQTVCEYLQNCYDNGYQQSIYVGPHGKLLCHEMDYPGDNATYFIAESLEALKTRIAEPIAVWLEVKLGEFPVERLEL